MRAAFVVGGVASGVGKTTVTLGLLAALRRRGLTVQAFKVGPDFIDPGFHALATGRPSWNLDGWLMGRDAVVDTFHRYAATADVAIIEGVMGCFDARDGASETGSTAEIAKWLGLPLVLVVDVGAQARTAAAVVFGVEGFDPDLNVAGVILNRTGGVRHASDVADAIRVTCGARPLGALGWDHTIALPERHLGLVTAIEGQLDASRLDGLADAVARGVDLDQLLTVTRWHPARCGPAREPVVTKHGPDRIRLGVAYDAAFQFYYLENLERLRAAGAEIVFWSPLADARLPEVDGLYFGGGYPELHAAALAGNTDLHADIRAFSDAGRPVYAECGGLMFLAETLEDGDGHRHRMVGLLPGTVRMQPGRLHIGYREIVFAVDTPLGPSGTVARGQEFHASMLDGVSDDVDRAWRLGDGGDVVPEGYLRGRTLMTYAHVHFASNSALATHFVQACADARAVV